MICLWEKCMCNIQLFRYISLWPIFFSLVRIEKNTPVRYRPVQTNERWWGQDTKRCLKVKRFEKLPTITCCPFFCSVVKPENMQPADHRGQICLLHHSPSLDSSMSLLYVSHKLYCNCFEWCTIEFSCVEGEGRKRGGGGRWEAKEWTGF